MSVRSASGEMEAPRAHGRSSGMNWSVKVVMVSAMRWVLRRLAFLLSLVVVIAGWWLYVRWARVPTFVFPSPRAVADALYGGLVNPPNTQAGYLFNLWVTLKTALIGFGLGASIGLALAILAASWQLANRVIMPYAAALQALPKIAIAPLLVLWFGFGINSKIVLAAMLVFFPVLVNTYRGLVDADLLLIDVMRVSCASKWQMLRYVRMPSALPFLFAALQIGIIEALLGAIVGEFVGAQAGAGVQIVRLQLESNIAAVFAILVLLGLIGALLSLTLELIRRRVVFWT